MPRYDADWIDFMLRPERRESPPAEAILREIGLGPGQIVADVGCGPGFFTLPAARLVGPAGMVYAVDVEPTMLERVQLAAAAEALRNVVVRPSAGLPVPLDDHCADLTLCALVLHDLTDPLPLVRELIRITRPEGRIAVIEWTPEMSDPRRNRIPSTVATRLFAAAGRPNVAITPLSAKQYLLLSA